MPGRRHFTINIGSALFLLLHVDTKLPPAGPMGHGGMWEGLGRAFRLPFPSGWLAQGGKTMRQTTQREAARLLAVDIDGLAAMLSCGQATARKIGEDAGARILIGRRVLYSVDRVQRYLDAIAQ